MPHFKAVIFDLDGTLLDTLADIANSMNCVLQRYNFPVRPIVNYRYYVGGGMGNLVENVLEDIPATEAQKSDLLKDFRAEYEKQYLLETKPYDGIMEAFSALGIYGEPLKLGVLSNKADSFTKKMVQYYFPLVPFSQVRGAMENVPSKPNPQALLEMAEHWGIAANEIIFVGDSDVDMQTARNAGSFAAGVLWGFREAAELLANGADVLLEKPLDLLNILK